MITKLPLIYSNIVLHVKN